MDEIKKLYRLYYDGLYHYFCKFTNNKDTAEELVQETFYQAMISIHRFEGKSSHKTWVYQIAKHVYSNYMQKKSNSEKPFDPVETMIIESSEVEKEFIENDELNHWVKKIENVPEPHRQILKLYLIENWSYGEIAKHFNKSENWVRVTYHRAKEKLIQLGSDE
jgi:RNA polymerase sigma-70 factor (ECF subfamily)